MTYLFVAVLLGLAPAAIAHSKGGNFFLWWLYGAAIWIVAFPHALMMRADDQALENKALAAGQKKCPDCAELIRQEAVVCRHCGLKLPQGVASAPQSDVQPVANSSESAARKNVSGAQPPAPVENNAERIVLGFVCAALVTIILVGVIAAIPSMNEHAARQTATLTGSTPSNPGNVLPLTPPRRTIVASDQQVAEARVTATAVGAQSSECREVSQHGFVHFLVCDPNARSADWRRAGVEACRGRRVCNVWVWDKVDKAGTSLPMTDAEVNSAVALWVQARNELMDCRKMGC